MNINGHEVTDDGFWYTVDGHSEWRTDTSAEFIEGYIKRMEEKILRARAVVEHKRREAAEKAAQDAADELDRRAEVVRKAWYGAPACAEPIEPIREAAIRVVRALDADAAAREA